MKKPFGYIDHRDAHRDNESGGDCPATERSDVGNFSDVEWAQQQPDGPPKYKIGDVVKFHVGGYGVIREVHEPHGGWPSSYATETPEGFDGHATGKGAWHYEGDFDEWVAKSPLHSLQSAKDQRHHG